MKITSYNIDCVVSREVWDKLSDEQLGDLIEKIDEVMAPVRAAVEALRIPDVTITMESD